MSVEAFVFAILFSVVLGIVLTVLGRAPVPPLWAAFKPVILFLERKWHREGRSRNDLVMRGAITMGVSFLLLIPLIMLFQSLIEAAANPLTLAAVHGGAFALFALSTAPSFALFKLSRYFQANQPSKTNTDKIAENRDSHIVLRSLSRGSEINLIPMDEASIKRHAIGFAVQMTGRMFFGSLIWFLLFGGVGVMIYSIIQLNAYYLGRYGYHEGYGQVPVWLGQLSQWPGQMLFSALLLLLSVVSPGLRTLPAVLALAAQKLSPNWTQGGFPLFLLAQSAGYGLGGPLQSRDGRSYPCVWVGSGKTSSQFHHSQLYIFTIALGLSVAVGAALVFLFFPQ